MSALLTSTLMFGVIYCHSLHIDPTVNSFMSSHILAAGLLFTQVFICFTIIFFLSLHVYTSWSGCINKLHTFIMVLLSFFLHNTTFSQHFLFLFLVHVPWCSHFLYRSSAYIYTVHVLHYSTIALSNLAKCFTFSALVLKLKAELLLLHCVHTMSQYQNLLFSFKTRSGWPWGQCPAHTLCDHLPIFSKVWIFFFQR